MSERPAFVYTQVLGAVGESGSEIAAHVQIQVDAQPALQLMATIGADAWLLLLTILMDSKTDSLGNIYCQASYDDLATRLGWGRDRVSKTLRRLQGAKLVDRVQEKVPSGSGVRFARQRIYVTYREALVSFLSLPGAATGRAPDAPVASQLRDVARISPATETSSQVGLGNGIFGSEEDDSGGQGNAVMETTPPTVSMTGSSQLDLGNELPASGVARTRDAARARAPRLRRDPGGAELSQVPSSQAAPGSEFLASEQDGGQHHDVMMNVIHSSGDGDDAATEHRIALVSAALITWGFTDVPAILREYQLNAIEAAVQHTLAQIDAGRVSNPGGLCRTILKSGRVPSLARRPAPAQTVDPDEVAQHDFTPDSSGISCAVCQTPAKNRLHARPESMLDERAGIDAGRPAQIRPATSA